MYLSDDPALDFARLDVEQARAEARLPKCDMCGGTINADFYWEIGGEILCEDCMNLIYRKYTSDFVEGE